MRNHAKIALFRAAIFALLLAACNPMLSAADKSQAEQTPADLAKTIAPFIDEQTVAIAHIDFTKIKVGPLVDKAAEVVPELKPQLAAAKAAGGAMLAAVKLAGGRDVYYVVTIGGQISDKDMLFAVVPLGEKSNIDTLTALLKQTSPGAFTETERMDNCLVAGSSRTIERLKSLKPDRRPEIEAAFSASGGRAVQLLILPPSHFRRVVEEMMPTLPEKTGGGSSKCLSDGLLWAAISVDAPPRLALRCAVQSRDEKSAQALLDTWNKLYPRLFDDDSKGTKGLLGKAGLAKSHIDNLFELLTPKLNGGRLELLLDEDNGGITKLVGIARPVIESARSSAEQAHLMNKYKQLALSMHNYHEAKGSFPAAASYDANGRPLLSWRVHLLPYAGHEELYKKFHLDESWDSPHNKSLIPKIPNLYRVANPAMMAPGMTRCVVPVGEKTVFSGKTGLCLEDLKSVCSKTIMIVEAAAENVVPWTKPADLQYDPQNPAKGLSEKFPEGFTAVFCDGHVESVSKKTDPEKLRKLFDCNR